MVLKVLVEGLCYWFYMGVCLLVLVYGDGSSRLVVVIVWWEEREERENG